MKRFKKLDHDAFLPVKLSVTHAKANSIQPAIFFGSGFEIESGCLRCPDAPCTSWDLETVSRTIRIESIANLDLKVCPTDSLEFHGDGFPNVLDTCIGCGLCITRCPVRAIHFDPLTTRAQVSNTPNSYTKFVGSFEEFEEFRKHLSGLFEVSSMNESQLEILQSVIQKIGALGQSFGDLKSLQILVRNAFLASGFAARLKNPGDNNNWTELAVDSTNQLFAFELEVGTDGLDSVRRVMSNLAIVCSRYGVALGDVVPVVIMSQLPNLRSDYYSVVLDAKMRLGVKILTVPIALIILSILDRDFDLLGSIQSHCYVDVANVSSCSISQLLGLGENTALAAFLGLIPRK